MPQDVVVRLTGLSLRVRTWPGPPDASPAVLLAGTGATAEDWDAVAAALQPTRPVHAVDLRGHGGSDRPGDYAITSMAGDVVDLLPRLAPGPVDLVGHSLGGLVALRVASTAPDLVRRVVLEDVGVLHPRSPAPPPRPAGDLPFDWAVVEQVRPQVDAPAPDWADVLATVSCPLLVVAGGATSPVPAAHVQELVDAVADGRAVTLDTGHGVHEAAPEQFVRHVREFLDR